MASCFYLAVLTLEQELNAHALEKLLMEKHYDPHVLYCLFTKYRVFLLNRKSREGSSNIFCNPSCGNYGGTWFYLMMASVITMNLKQFNS